jgi:hypothetical protein
MWSLIIVGILTTSPINKATGSVELRFDTKEECLAAKAKIDENNSFKYNRLMTSCGYRGYLK